MTSGTQRACSGAEVVRETGHRAAKKCQAALVLCVLLATAPALADIRCDQHAETCTMDLDRARQCVTDAHELADARLELDARLEDLRGLQLRHQRIGFVLDETAEALARERDRWSPWTWVAIGGTAVLVLEAVAVLVVFAVQ